MHPIATPSRPLPHSYALDLAWDWLCHARRHFPPNADIWDLRHRWSDCRAAFLQQLQSGTYQLSPMQRVGKRHPRILWSSKDALALKWLELKIPPFLPVHPACEHVKGHGGGPQSVQRLKTLTQGPHAPYTWVCRTDIKGYYANIDKSRLLNQLQRHITDPALMALLTQYVHYTVDLGGVFHPPKKGIPRGCALSPLMGAFHLTQMDTYFAQKRVHYVRYMDDFVLLTQTRGQLRKAIRQLNQWFAAYGFTQHPDKTVIGRVAKGVDWMGAWLTDHGITGVAPRALDNHRTRCRQLYEQTSRLSVKQQADRVSQYRARWSQWVQCVLKGPKTAACPRTAPSGTTTGHSKSSTHPHPTSCTPSPLTLSSRFPIMGR
ncbi:Retron-type reverse transcriptase [Providencia rettgeri]|uniref:Retron-type reverse transcriptase n=2 Tax=Providencia rettgeri TaxID=587 RepID=A0A379FTG7_PRORE|nr:Retron-type reverse transcriptase [Providencia rettgeri]